MTPFQQLQVWTRRAGLAQRSLASVAVVVVLALVAWLVWPAGHDDAQVAAFGPSNDFAEARPSGSPTDTAPDASRADETAAAGSSEGTAATDGTPGPTGGDAPSTGAEGDGGGQPDQAPATEGPRCPAGTGQGATDTEFRVAVTIINIAGALGNSTIGVPTPAKQRQQWQTVADAINAEGGAGCRQMKLELYDVNPVDANDAQSKCLQIARSGPFIALDTGSLTSPGASDCIPNQKIPMVAHGLSREQMATYAPYYISQRGIVDDVIRNGYLAHRQLGSFSADKGFEKLGVLVYSCRKDPIEATRRALAEAGLSRDQIVEFDMGCPPGGQSSPAEHQQAVLTFKRSGVTNVTFAGNGDFANFVNTAAQQNYDPEFTFADSEIVAVTGGGGSLQPHADTFDGAITIGNLRYGEDNTPGFQPGEGTSRCNAIFAAAGEPPVYDQEVGYGGVVCSMLWMVKALVDNTPAMQREALVQGMNRIGTMDFSYPEGPVDFSATPPGTPFGKPAWRAAVFSKECRCFQVPDPAFQPSFR